MVKVTDRKIREKVRRIEVRQSWNNILSRSSEIIDKWRPRKVKRWSVWRTGQKICCSISSRRVA